MPLAKYMSEISEQPISTAKINENNWSDSNNWLGQFSPSNPPATETLNEYINYRKRKLKAIAPLGQNPRALIELGDFHVIRGKYKHAVNTYRNALKLDPNSVEAYKKLIPMLHATGDVTGAERYFKELIKLTNGHPEVLNDYFGFKLAIVNTEAEIDQLKSEIKATIKSNAGDAKLFVTLGLLYLVRLNDLASAEKNFQYALTLDSSNIDATNNLGICLQRKKKHEAAFSQFVTAIKLDKFYLPAYENIASNAAAEQDFSTAVKYLEKAKQLNLELSDTWDHNYGWFLIQLERFEEAAKWYEKKIPEQPDNSFLYNNLGVCLEQLDDKEGAKIYYVAAIEKYSEMQAKNPTVFDTRAEDAFLNACRLLQKFNDFERLEVAAKTMLNIGISPAAGFYYLGAASIQLRKYSVAEKYLSNSLDINDEVIHPYIDLSYFYDSINFEYDKAIKLLEKALSKDIKDPMLYNNLAYAYLKSGQIDKAKKILSKDLIEPSFNATKGLLYLYENKLKLANKEYESAVSSFESGKQLEAMQVWKFELAAFWHRKGDLDKSLELLLEAKKLSSKEVIYPQIIALEKTIKEDLKSRTLK